MTNNTAFRPTGPCIRFWDPNRDSVNTGSSQRLFLFHKELVSFFRYRVTSRTYSQLVVGHKGQNARSGAGPHRSFEGGQTPITKLFPKRGFFNQ